MEQIPKNTNEQIIEASDIRVNAETGLAIVVVKPDAFRNRDQIIKRLEQAGLYIVKTVTKKLPEDFVDGVMYNPLRIKEATLRHFNSGPSEIILLRGGDDVLNKVVTATGLQTDPEKCDEKSIRYIFGEHFGRDTEEGELYFHNAVHRGKSEKEKNDDLENFKPLMS